MTNHDPKLLASVTAKPAKLGKLSKLAVTITERNTIPPPLPKPELNAASQASLDRALAGIDGEVKAANERIAKAAEAEHLAKMVAVTAEVETSRDALAKAHDQMAKDGCPATALRKPGEKPAPLANGAKLPRSAPGREMAVPTAKQQTPKTPQTKREQEAMAKKMGLTLDARKPSKNSKPGARERYDWTAAVHAAKKGTIPSAPDFSADTHRSYRSKLAELVALVKAKDIKGLTKWEPQRLDGSPLIMKRYRDIALVALKAK